MKTVFLETTTSTNTEAMRSGEQGAAHGTAVWALEQSAGRGRLGKTWSSRRGDGLYVSFVLRPQVAVEELARITLVAGLVLARLIRAKVLPGREVGLKWPNDVLINGKKVAGILVEAAPAADQPSFWVVAGIGVNVRQQLKDFPDHLRQQATSLRLECGQEFELSLLVAEIRDKLLAEVTRFEQGGFADILDEWRMFDCLQGREMECVAVDGSVVSGVALGPDTNGILHVRDRAGAVHEILSGDITLAGTPKPPR